MDTTMKQHTVTNILALAGALIALFGVTFAASSAFADEAIATIDATATAIHESAGEPLDQAREANEAAAQEAADAVAKDLRLNLEIPLIDLKLT
jgi:parvulin-like peptidyl-prolyl isomerase